MERGGRQVVSILLHNRLKQLRKGGRREVGRREFSIAVCVGKREKT